MTGISIWHVFSCYSPLDAIANSVHLQNRQFIYFGLFAYIRPHKLHLKMKSLLLTPPAFDNRLFGFSISMQHSKHTLSGDAFKVDAVSKMSIV